MPQNINRVVMTGNLTRDPELRSTTSGMSVCSLRIACNTRRKGAGGEWEDKPNFFDVVVWGAHGENCARYLAKGKPVAVDGRLEWREFEDRNTGQRRQAIDIVADSVQFLGGRDDDGGGQARSDVPASDGGFSGSGFSPAPSGAANAIDDDIPFRWNPPSWDDRTHGFNPFGGAS